MIWTHVDGAFINVKELNTLGYEVWQGLLEEVMEQALINPNEIEIRIP